MLVWTRDASLDLLTIPDVQVVPRWNSRIADCEVVVFDSADLSRHFLRLASARVPVIGGGRGLHLFEGNQGAIYHKLGIPTIPKPRGAVHTTWGLFSDRWHHIDGHKGGESLLVAMSPYLSYTGYRGPWAVRWSKRIFSHFLVDSGPNLGYARWIEHLRESPLPADLQLKGLLTGWR